MTEAIRPWKDRVDAGKKASTATATLPSEKKNDVLVRLASLLVKEEKSILEANQEDVSALPTTAPEAFRDRLTLTSARIAGMAESLREVALLPDPVGETVGSQTLSNGLRVRRMRSPLGTILMIFESRPNVAVESFSLAFKSGNVIWLRGGKESRRTVSALGDLMVRALREARAPEEAVVIVSDPDRSIVDFLLTQKQYFDVVVPRGGDQLIEHVSKNSLIPVIKNDRGMCHVYVDASADLEMAAAIVENAKTQRPGVCNAMETLLIHRQAAQAGLGKIYDRITAGKPRGVTWHVCDAAAEILEGREKVVRASAKDWDTEYLDLHMNCKVVDSLEEALLHIARHGSRHSEAIVTADESHARRFQGEVDAAAVYWNASTRFTDGFQLGLGGELGISTQKLHVRGPVGLKELTSVRWVFDGTGQVRK